MPRAVATGDPRNIPSASAHSPGVSRPHTFLGGARLQEEMEAPGTRASVRGLRCGCGNGWEQGSHPQGTPQTAISMGPLCLPPDLQTLGEPRLWGPCSRQQASPAGCTCGEQRAPGSLGAFTRGSLVLTQALLESPSQFCLPGSAVGVPARVPKSLNHYDSVTRRPCQQHPPSPVCPAEGSLIASRHPYLTSSDLPRP